MTNTAVARARRRPVVLTTDIGTDMDDQWLLAHLVLAPEVDLRGVVTNHAPNLRAPAAETALGHARTVLDTVSALPHFVRRPPVRAGASAPLKSAAEPSPNAGVRFLLDASRAAFTPARRLAVLMAGPATDVASALLLDPTFADRIEIIAMGFERWPEGGDPWNVKNDPRAWQVVLASRAPITVGDAQVTGRRLSLSRAEARALLESLGAPGRYLADLHTAWVDKSDPNFLLGASGRRDAWPVWDEVIAAHLLGLTTSVVYPRPTLADDLRFVPAAAPAASSKTTIRWITDINAERLWTHLAQCVQQ